MNKRATKSGTRASNRRAEPVRYAVIGQGYIAQIAVLPAFSHARRNSRLVALVSDDPKKLKVLGKRYKVDKLYSYAEVDELFSSGDVDAVYIALPNSMHSEYTVRAAKAGLHVLCEKPMAVTSAECEEMMRATEESGVKLMIAYRLHFERATLEAVSIARRKQIGELRFFSSQFSMQVKDRDNIRLQRELGGGPLYDIGIYCINAVRALFGEEPHEVWAASANSGDSRFDEIPETVAVTLKFSAGRIASFVCSFGSGDTSAFQLVGTKGSVHMDPAYEYAEGLSYELRIGDRRRKRKFAQSDQFAPELLYFSACVQKNRDPEPSGMEGLADVRIIEALRRSMETGATVALPKLPAKPKRPGLAQEIRKPAAKKASLVHANAP